MKTPYKFPYYNAGKATYYEWFDLIVVLKTIPTQEQQEQIKKIAPAPVGEVFFEGEYMSVLNDTNVHADISKTYKTKDGKYMQNEDEEWASFVSADSQVQAFNLDVERWLKEAHQISPIYFAFKSEEDGVEIIQYSDWHQWSLGQYKTILPYFETEINNGYDYYDFSEKANVIQNILTKIEETSSLDEIYAKFLYPGKLEHAAFENNNIEPLKDIKNPRYAEKTITFFNKNLKKRHAKNLNKYADAFLSFQTLVEEHTFHDLATILFKYLDDIDTEMFKEAAKYITNVNALAEEAFELAFKKSEYKKATKLFIKLLMVPTEPSVESGFYTNLLWVLQNDNTGIPVNEELNQLALQKCLPKGKEYPAIFFNACCLYVEMEDYKKAYEMVEIALANYFDAKTMLQQIENEYMFNTFRKETTVLHLLKNYRCESLINPEPRLISSSIAYHLYSDMVNIKNDLGYTINFTKIILINGHVETEREFSDMYNMLPQVKKTKAKVKYLTLVNGNLAAKSITQYGDEFIVVLGKITCNTISHNDIIEVGETSFEYVPLTAKRHHEE